MGNNSSTSTSDAIAVGVPVAHAASPTDSTTAAAAVPPPSTVPPPAAAPAQKKLDLVFTMDCTGSMGSYIAAAKQGITRIAEKLAQAEGYDLRFGLVAYRDHPPQDSSYVTKSFPFTNSLGDMQQSLGTLSAQGGGDGPEAVAAALKATLEAGWREDATKVVVLIADAPPHGLGENGDGFPDGGPDGVDPLVMLDAMSAKGITIYSVGCQPALSQYRFATEFFIACAQRTNGQAVALGSAAALADVILGASVEEMDLEGLTAQVQQMTAELRLEAPELADDVVEQRVFGMLQAQGTRCRKVGGARLKSSHAGLVSAAPSLAVAKASLAEKGPSPRAPQGLDAFRASKAAISGGARCAPRMARCAMPAAAACSMAMPAAAAAPPPAVLEERVELEEGSISMEQVSRLYGRGKKKGLW